jgi:ArsR family transcriptional regulator
MGMDLVFKALADPTRREILRLLNGGEMTAGQIAEHFAITGPSLSHHFGILKQADLIAARRNGQQIHYSLNTTVFQDLLGVLFDLFGKTEERGKTDVNS